MPLYESVATYNRYTLTDFGETDVFKNLCKAKDPSSTTTNVSKTCQSDLSEQVPVVNVLNIEQKQCPYVPSQGPATFNIQTLRSDADREKWKQITDTGMCAERNNNKYQKILDTQGNVKAIKPVMITTTETFPRRPHPSCSVYKSQETFVSTFGKTSNAQNLCHVNMLRFTDKKSRPNNSRGLTRSMQSARSEHDLENWRKACDSTFMRDFHNITSMSTPESQKTQSESITITTPNESTVLTSVTIISKEQKMLTGDENVYVKEKCVDWVRQVQTNELAKEHKHALGIQLFEYFLHFVDVNVKKLFSDTHKDTDNHIVTKPVIGVLNNWLESVCCESDANASISGIAFSIVSRILLGEDICNELVHASLFASQVQANCSNTSSTPQTMNQSLLQFLELPNKLGVAN